jgi:HSP90 family molecular chaperone
MIIDKESKDVIKSEELKSIKYSIDSDNFGLLFKMLRDNLYQNKEYTIIREYVSNAIDAHTEYGVDKPVEIEWVDASELLGIDTQLIIRDFGIGLSEDRVTNIFGKYLSSTKRTDNNSIGGLTCRY